MLPPMIATSRAGLAKLDDLAHEDERGASPELRGCILYARMALYGIDAANSWRVNTPARAYSIDVRMPDALSYPRS